MNDKTVESAARSRAPPSNERGTIVDDDHAGLLTRRRLLATGAIAVASVTLPDTTASASPRRAAVSAKATPRARFARKGYRRSRFEPHVGTVVKLRPHGGTAVRVQLAAVEDVAYVKGLAGAADAYATSTSARCSSTSRPSRPTAGPRTTWRRSTVASRAPRAGRRRLAADRAGHAPHSVAAAGCGVFGPHAGP